jgi:hypothetical protein
MSRRKNAVAAPADMADSFALATPNSNGVNLAFGYDRSTNGVHRPVSLEVLSGINDI